MKTHFDADLRVSWLREESFRLPDIWRELVDDSNIFYIVRHPMDVMTSYHQFLSGVDRAIAEMEMVEFLKSQHWDGSSDRLNWWMRHVSNWAARPGVVVLRYEDIIRHPSEVLERISASISEAPKYQSPILPPKVTSRLQTRKDRMFSLCPASTAIVADRSRYPAYDWRKNLSSTEIAAINARLHPILRQFNYSMVKHGP